MRTQVFRYGLLAGLAMVWLAGAARADDSREYLVKAAFIYNFIKFVEWPGERHVANQSRMDVCILGDSPMQDTAAVFRQGSTAKLSLSLVTESNVAAAASHCHIVFVGPSESSRLGDILAGLKGSPVLTVSDIEGFARKGGMVGFVTRDNKVKLIVNKRAAAAAGLRVDAQLLEIALEVIH